MTSSDNSNKPCYNLRVVKDGKAEQLDEDAFQKTRKSLIERLDDWQDQKTWMEFHDIYWRVIYRFSLRNGLRDDEAFDVVQETLLAVAKQSKDGRYDPRSGTFKSWLFNLTRWRIADQFRKRDRFSNSNDTSHQQTDGLPRTATIERIPDAKASDHDAIWEQEWKQNASQVAVKRVRNQVSPKQFQIFDCYVIKEWPTQKVQQDLGVSIAQIYLAKHRIGTMLQKELKRLERADF